MIILIIANFESSQYNGGHLRDLRYTKVFNLFLGIKSGNLYVERNKFASLASYS